MYENFCLFEKDFSGIELLNITNYITPKPRDLDVSAPDSDDRYSDVRDDFIGPNYKHKD
jgi:hypothetical protein